MSTAVTLIRPNPAIVVRADEPIFSCIALMRARNIGSVLVVSDDSAERLEGIFTERDVLTKFGLITTGEHWNRPVRTVMTQPVITLELSKLRQAGATMLANGIRHLPIVVPDPAHGPKLVGIVSMRDVFRVLLAGKDRREAPSVQCLVYTRDPEFLEAAAALGADITGIHLTRPLPVLAEGQALADVPGQPKPILILDIDGVRVREWMRLLQSFGEKGRTEQIVLAYTPQRHPARVGAILEKFRNGSQLSIFRKPASTEALSSLLARRQASGRRPSDP